MVSPGVSYRLGKVASGAACSALGALTLNYAVKQLYRGLWQINSLSYNIFMSQTPLWAWSGMHWPTTYVWVLERHSGRDFNKLTHVFQSQPQVAFATISYYLILLKSFLFLAHLQYTLNQEIQRINMTVKKLGYNSLRKKKKSKFKA